MKIRKMYVKNIESYQTGMLIEVENWVYPQSLLKEVHQDNTHLNIEDCYIKTLIYIDEEENNMPMPKTTLFVPCNKVEFI